MALYGIEYLRKKLSGKQARVDLRYSFYEMKHIARDLGISTPPNLLWLHSCLGWCAQSVDSLADRLVFRQFDTDTDIANMNEIFAMNNPDVLCDAAVLSALVSSCSFIYIAKGNDGYPKMQVIDGGNATGIIDSTTGLLSEGYAVLDRDDQHRVTLEAYFEPFKTTFYPKGGQPYSITSNCPYPLLVPIVYRPDDVRPFGHSRISRAQMALQESACRGIVRLEVGSEFWSFPQKYVTGLSNETELPDKWRMALSSFMAFFTDSDGNKPQPGQFQSASPQPTIDELKTYAALFGAETGLTMDDLGFSTGTVASADATKAAHTKLNLAARKAQRCFGSGLLNVGMVAACVRDNREYNRKEFYSARPVWMPLFEPDGASMGAIGDAILKTKQVDPDAITTKDIREMFGL